MHRALAQGLRTYFEWFPEVKDFWRYLYKSVLEYNYILHLPNGSPRFIRKSLYVTPDWAYGDKEICMVGSTLNSVYHQSLAREIVTEKKHELIKEGICLIGDKHDEFIFEETENAIPIIKKILEAPVSYIDKPLLQVEFEVSDTWGPRLI